MGAIIIWEPSQWLKQSFRNGPLYAAQSHTCTCIKITIKTKEKPPIKCYNVKTIVEVLLCAPHMLWLKPTFSLKKYLHYCFNILKFYGWFVLFFNLNFNACASVWLCCMQRTVSWALLSPLWRLPVDGTHGVPKLACVVYIFQCMKGWFYELLMSPN